MTYPRAANLKLRHLTWWAVLWVPRDVQPILGKKHLTRTLKTRDLTQAKARARPVLADFQAIIDAARNPPAPVATDLPSEAMQLRRLREATEDQDIDDNLGVVTRAEQIEQSHGIEQAEAFARRAFGTSTPIQHHVEGWLAEATYPHRSQTQHRGTLAELERFCTANGHVADLQAITRALAGRWVAVALGEGQQRQTVQRKLSTLRVYWAWMTARDILPGNPWAGIKLAKAKLQNPDDEVRAFSDAEVWRLLNGGADPVLLDFIRISALSGARLESIAQLTVGDCANRVFWIRQDKSKSGTRRVPIHSGLRELVDRRRKGRADPDKLFPELAARASGSRSAAISTRFNRYRVGLGIDERREGRRGSLTNFHSFRHFFITAALRAGQTDHVVAQVVGHAAQSLARRTYFDGDLEATLRACVESVKLPTGPDAATTSAAAVDVDAAPP